MSRTSGPATKAALLESGLLLLEKEGLQALSVEDITRQAGVAKGTFYVHFPDRASFLLAIHRDFHDRLRDAILQAINGRTPGRRRLLAGATVYLDACRQQRAVKALLFEGRHFAELRAEVERRNAAFASLASQDFAALLKGASAEVRLGCARLFVAMCAEVALAELHSRRRLPAMRRSLARMMPASSSQS